MQVSKDLGPADSRNQIRTTQAIDIKKKSQSELTYRGMSKALFGLKKPLPVGVEKIPGDHSELI